MKNDKRTRFERERAQKLMARLTIIISVMAAFVTIVAYWSSIETYHKIESTMNYENADTTQIVKLVNDMNDMYRTNMHLRDSINALNKELDFYRTKYGPIESEQKRE